MNQFTKHRQLKNFLLDKRFQLKYTLAVVVITSALAVVLGFFLYRSQQETSQVALVGLEEEVKATMAEELAKEDRKVLFTLVAFLGGMVLALTVLGIVATHKIAGPAYAVRRNLSRIADGELPTIRELRRGDELVSVVDELKRMVDSLRARDTRDVEALEKALQALGTEEAAQAVTAALQPILREKQTRLADRI